MSNKELIENLARKLDKFDFIEITTLSEIDENEVKNIINELINENKIIKRENLYFYQKISINKKLNRREKYTNVPPFEPEKMDGYDEYLKLTGRAKHLSDMRIIVLKMTHGLYGKDVKNMLNLYNSQHPNDKIASSTLAFLKSQFKNYGLKGILAKNKHTKKDEFPTIIYETFKKYYLNKNKFSTEEALRFAQIELQNAHKIEFPQVYCAKPFIARLLKEMGKETITYLRNTFDMDEDIKNKPTIKEPTDMLFSEAAKIYFKTLSNNKNLERLMNEKTSYKNHIAEFFDDYKISDINAETLRNFKQNIYNAGYSLSSVKIYINTVRSIILNLCPQTSNFKKRISAIISLNMNILNDNQIKGMLELAENKYKWGYPIIRIALSTGATVPEILALTWENINFTHYKIYIKQFVYLDKILKHKINSSFRYLTIDKEVVKSLIDIYQRQNYPDNKEFVFKIKDNKNMQQYFADNVLTPICNELKISNFIASDLTHNFVHLLQKQNAPLQYIQKVCGYASLTAFFEVYNSQFKIDENAYYNPLENL